MPIINWVPSLVEGDALEPGDIVRCQADAQHWAGIVGQLGQDLYLLVLNSNEEQAAGQIILIDAFPNIWSRYRGDFIVAPPDQGPLVYSDLVRGGALRVGPDGVPQVMAGLGGRRRLLRLDDGQLSPSGGPTDGYPEWRLLWRPEGAPEDTLLPMFDVSAPARR